MVDIYINKYSKLNYTHTYAHILGSPCGSAGKESACHAEDLGSIPALGRAPGEVKGYPLQYFGLENSMDCIVHGVTKSWTRMSDFHFTCSMWGFPSSSAGKESACNAEEPCSFPGSGRSPGEGIGYSLQKSWISLVAQRVKNPPAMKETWVPSLGWEDHLWQPTPVFLPGESRWTEEPSRIYSMGSQRVQHD